MPYNVHIKVCATKDFFAYIKEEKTHKYFEWKGRKEINWEQVQIDKIVLIKALMSNMYNKIYNYNFTSWESEYIESNPNPFLKQDSNLLCIHLLICQMGTK